MRTHVSPSAGATIVDKLKVYEGGTGQTTPSAVLAQMGAVTQASINQPGGIASLSALGALAANLFPINETATISITGPTSVLINSVTEYTIKNYDCFTDYALTSTNGVVLRDKDKITFIAGSTPGAAGFTINGRQISITLNDIVPNTPTLNLGTQVINGTTIDVPLTGSAFQVTGSTATHQSTDWEISLVADFSTTVRQLLNSTTSKTSNTFTGLTHSTVHYARARYRDTNGKVSAWSATLQFTTISNVVPDTLPTLDLNSSFSSQVAGPSKYFAIGTYTGTIRSVTTNVGTSANYVFSGGTVYYSGDLPVAYSGAQLTLTVTNNAGSASDSGTFNVTSATNTITGYNLSFPVNQAIATFSPPRKTIATSGLGISSASVNSGSLPPGVSISANQGGNGDVIVSGTPTQAGTYNFTLLCYTSGGYTTDTPKVSPTITLTITP